MKPDNRTFWARMFATHQAALAGFFRRRMAHPWDAQDLAQEVYVRLLRIDSGESGNIANPEAYLFTVASNLVKEHAVLQKRYGRGVDIAQVLPELEAPQGSAEDEAITGPGSLPRMS
ncbi:MULTISPECIES: RNA polymerase sigma factor [Rhodanobacter]|uniref:RNA polymerase sigma factor n=1 Tax=Rhodanobacter TaxID=75309 RepID=UPI000426407F|nr:MULTISPECIES: RNA polymerase sigma factor [Rhodanobacter]UJJ54733.1 RNA polymerase sigma factor [Rhodanobacter thiooxydans]